MAICAKAIRRLVLSEKVSGTRTRQSNAGLPHPFGEGEERKIRLDPTGDWVA